MILLSGHSITPERKVPTQSLGVTLKERDSTATMVPLDMTGITDTSWFYDEKQPGGGTAWRVKSITEAYDTHTPTVQLEHVINTLKDRIMFGEITPGMMAGNDKATVCTAEQAIRYILSYQDDWVLGDLQYNVANPYKFNGDTLFDALETVTKSLKDAWWAYDMTVYPFRLLIIKKNDDVFSEMRCGRNIRTIRKTVDKSGMFTRFYPIGKDDLHIDGDFVEMNSYQFGVISKVDTDASIDNKDELRRWAAEQLEIHSRPTVTIDVDGFELADATGESLDSLTLGRVCRVPMPEYSMTFEERIASIQYPDKLRQPNVVKVTLSNNRTDVMKVIADAMKKSSGGGRKAAVQQKEDHAWFVDTDEKVGMVAESIVGTGDGVWKRISSLVVDGEGIHAKVQKNEGDIVTAFTRIDQNENRIILEAQRAVSAENTLSASITVEADRITQEVQNRISGQTELGSRITQTATRIDQEVYARIQGDTNLDSRITQTANMIDMEVTRAKAAEGTLSGRITVEAGKITQIVSAVGQNGQVTAASICLAINNGGSSATINAGKIYLLGQTIANTVDADYITTKLASANAATIKALTVTNGLTISGNSSLVFSGGDGATLTGSTASDLIKNLKIERSGNTYTLQKVTVGDPTWTDVGSFSRAISSWVWGGGSGKINVTALPQDQTKSINVSIDGRSSITSNGTYTYTVDYENSSGDDVSTGATKDVTVNIPARSVSGIRVTGVTDPYWSENTLYENVGVAADYDTDGSYVTAVAVDVTAAYNVGVDAGESLVSDITLWDGNTELTDNITITSAKTVQAWCKYNGNWKSGTSITITPGNPYRYAADITFTESKVVGSYTYFYYYSTTGITTGTKRVHW